MPFCCNPGNGNCVELTEKEYSVCHLICANGNPVSFTELRQTFDFHQEILSRILRRLTIHNVIEKSNDGRYVAVCSSESIISLRSKLGIGKIS